MDRRTEKRTHRKNETILADDQNPKLKIVVTRGPR